jgi:hypothetical protein
MKNLRIIAALFAIAPIAAGAGLACAERMSPAVRSCPPAIGSTLETRTS